MRVPALAGASESVRPDVSAERAFHAALKAERRRAERSSKPFVLMLFDAQREEGTSRTLLQQASTVLRASTRETDHIGWYKEGAILGLIFTEVGSTDMGVTGEALRTKMRVGIDKELGAGSAAKITISFHIFPEHVGDGQTGPVADSKLYPELESRDAVRKISLAMKRAMDIAGSATLLLVMLPVFAVIAALIKLNSKGPVLFKQQRLGKYGARFNCLKFRSMYLNNSPKIHQDYVRQFIAGSADAGAQNGDKAVVYKITADPRITPIGRFLRKTSLDELPQFWNVLVGEMSLVGPRPPVPYEFEVYELWHRRRVLEVKPGITGLWQVSGRSSTRFDEMVRLDLLYCREWSLWLDLKILLATPKAVIFGSGAY
jgi:lipopolysaccharide/colanic/teichoic acid biosynthesis glycosyltransferase